MEFRYTEEQDQLRAVVRAFLAQHAGSAARRAAIERPDEALWTRVVGELELTGLQLPEEVGGSGASFVEVGIALEETGRTLIAAPYLPTVVAAAALRDTPGAARRIAAGEVATVALGASTAGARLSDGTWLVSGEHEHVLDGATASLVVVAARAGEDDALFLVDADAPGLTRTPQPPLDLTRPQATLALDSTPATPLTGATPGRVRDVAAVALACESVGAAARCLEMTVEYLKNRVQFGRVLGSFQALKHRCADLATEIEAATSTARYAAWAVDGAPEELELVAPLAKAYCADAFRHVAAETIQLHGGIGFSWEHDAHLYFKRAASTEMLFGPGRELRRRVGALAGLS